MRADTSALLSRIDASQNALLEASLSTQEQLDTMMGLLRQLIALLLPKESEDGPRLNEFLARMIAQQSALIELAKQNLACVTRIEAALTSSRPGEDAPQGGTAC
jgi:hypothetical protein